MQIQFSQSATIQEIQAKFKSMFSHLKLEFYKKPHHDEEGNLKKDQYLHNVTLGEIMTAKADISLSIEDTMTTADFEKWFETTHQLHVQLFRLQRGTWLQTTATDHLTLIEQNEKGIQADTNIEPESPMEIDNQ
jgi:hypothetical protein